MKFNVVIEVSEEQIGDLMVTAFEGGCNYWIRRVVINKNPQNKNYAYEVVASEGGEVTIFDDCGDNHILTREIFGEGLKAIMIEDGYSSIDDFMDDHDADTADRIVQMAIYKEIVFG